jgi:3',5'-cyclic AMP phosphodiesterase CpdA
MKIKIFLALCALLLLSHPAFSTEIKENEKAIIQFKENPPADEWTFAVMGDNRYTCWSCDWMYEKVIESMSGESFDFAINTGDFVDTGTEDRYLIYLERLQRQSFPTVHVLGNHDLPAEDSHDFSLFEKYFGRTYFYFDYQNARFIILNNASHEFGGEQRAWLDKTLAEAGNRLKFVFMHIPTFNPSRKPHYLIKWDEDLIPFEEIIRRNKVDILFTGHSHLYSDTVYKGIRTIVTGGAGAPLYETSDRGGFYHWVKVTVNGKSVHAGPVMIRQGYWSRVLYNTFYFFYFDLCDNWKHLLAILAVFLCVIISVKMLSKRK